MPPAAQPTTAARPDPRRGLGRVLAIALTVVLAIVGYRELVHPNLFPKRFGEVVPGQIYRSGKLTSAALTRVVRGHDIKTVIDLGAWVEDKPENRRANAREQHTAEALGATRHVFTLVGDATGDPNQYVDALRLMLDPANQPVLVHCGAGTERTGCVVAFYRMYAEGLDLEEALAEADAAGHDPERNPRLREVLERWSGAVLDSLETGERIPWDKDLER